MEIKGGITQDGENLKDLDLNLDLSEDFVKTNEILPGMKIEKRMVEEVKGIIKLFGREFHVVVFSDHQNEQEYIEFKNDVPNTADITNIAHGYYEAKKYSNALINNESYMLSDFISFGSKYYLVKIQDQSTYQFIELTDKCEFKFIERERIPLEKVDMFVIKGETYIKGSNGFVYKLGLDGALTKATFEQSGKILHFGKTLKIGGKIYYNLGYDSSNYYGGCTKRYVKLNNNGDFVGANEFIIEDKTLDLDQLIIDLHTKREIFGRTFFSATIGHTTYTTNQRKEFVEYINGRFKIINLEIKYPKTNGGYFNGSKVSFKDIIQVNTRIYLKNFALLEFLNDGSCKFVTFQGDPEGTYYEYINQIEIDGKEIFQVKKGQSEEIIFVEIDSSGHFILSDIKSDRGEINFIKHTAKGTYAQDKHGVIYIKSNTSGNKRFQDEIAKNME